MIVPYWGLGCILPQKIIKIEVPGNGISSILRISQHVSFFFNLRDLTPRSTPELYSYFYRKGRNTKIKKQPPSSEPVYILESLYEPNNRVALVLGQILLTVHIGNFTPVNSKKNTKSNQVSFLIIVIKMVE